MLRMCSLPVEGGYMPEMIVVRAGRRPARWTRRV